MHKKRVKTAKNTENPKTREGDSSIAPIARGGGWGLLRTYQYRGDSHQIGHYQAPGL